MGTKEPRHDAMLYTLSVFFPKLREVVGRIWKSEMNYELPKHELTVAFDHETAAVVTLSIQPIYFVDVEIVFEGTQCFFDSVAIKHDDGIERGQFVRLGRKQLYNLGIEHVAGRYELQYSILGFDKPSREFHSKGAMDLFMQGLRSWHAKRKIKRYFQMFPATLHDKFTGESTRVTS